MEIEVPMQLANFTERTVVEGDRLQAKEAVDRWLVVLVREHRTDVKTQYTPEGGDAVVVDVADVRTGEVWIAVLWMNGAVVDNLAPYVGKVVPVKLVWVPSAKGGNPYISVKALDGNELAAAIGWSELNPNRFEQERALRAQQQAQQAAQQVAAGGAQPMPGAPTQPPAWAGVAAQPAGVPGALAQTAQGAGQFAQQWAAPPAAAPAIAPAPVAAPPAAAPVIPPAANPATVPNPALAPNPTLNVNSPEVQALLATIANQQAAPGGVQ